VEENNLNKNNVIKNLSDILFRTEERYVQYENKLLSIARARIDRSYNRRRQELEKLAKVSARPLDQEFFQLEQEHKRLNLELKKQAEDHISKLKELEKKEAQLIEAIGEAEGKMFIADNNENEIIKRNLKDKEAEVLSYLKEVAISRHKIVS
jgi:hypothetical protein